MCVCNTMNVNMNECNYQCKNMRSPTKQRGQLHSQHTLPEGTLPSNHLGRAFANGEHLQVGSNGSWNCSLLAVVWLLVLASVSSRNSFGNAVGQRWASTIWDGIVGVQKAYKYTHKQSNFLGWHCRTPLPTSNANYWGKVFSNNEVPDAELLQF